MGGWAQMIGIIGGSGLYDPTMLTEIREDLVHTPFGDIHPLRGLYQGREVAFVPRHGKGHTVPRIWSITGLLSGLLNRWVPSG